MDITLESLGFSQEELQERVIDAFVERLFGAMNLESTFDDKARAMIDARVDAIADAHILPNVTQYMETLTLQKTNGWGEKKGAPVTFIEYLAERADAYMREEVNYEGKAKAQDSYNWRASGTRVAYMISNHLQYSIETAMKTALQAANTSIVGGIEAAIKVKLEELSKAIKVAATVKN